MFKLRSTDVLLPQVCQHANLQKEVDGPYDPNHKWITKEYPLGTPLTKIPCTCKIREAPGAKKVLPIVGDNNVILYSSCARTLFACMSRQCQLLPRSDPIKMKEFHEWFEFTFKEEIEPILRAFAYNPADWFNHLTVKQQAEILALSDNKQPKVFSDINIEVDEKPPKYSMFCKREVQIVDEPTEHYDGSSLPKARAISCPQGDVKYILGPITWAVEGLFAKFLKGYCGGKNWEEMEATLSEYYNKGFRYVCFGDGSGWDRCQSHELKHVDRRIYEFLATEGKITHVDPHIFLAKATPRIRKMVGKVHQDGRLLKMFECKVDSTVMTGNPDTTLMNTTRMAMVIRFIMSHTEHEFELWCKGDDFIIFLKEEVDLTPIFYQYWSKKGQAEAHGLGLVLKFLKTDTIDKFDFCSTNCIRTGDKFKIVRIPTRLCPLTHYSVKALSMSEAQQNAYMIEQAISIEDWAGSMPFFSDYAKLIRFFYKPTYVKPVKGHSKIELTDGVKLTKEEKEDLEKGFDHNYSHKLRKSKYSPPDVDVYDYLLKRYNLTKQGIEYHFQTARNLGVYELEVNNNL